MLILSNLMSLHIWPKKCKQKAAGLELMVAREKKVGALRKKLACLDKQVSNISVVGPANRSSKCLYISRFL